MIKEAMLYERLGEKKVCCHLCSHNCRILPGNYGICGVRQNIDGKLHTTVYGDIIAEHVDPIEKKPLYHFLPGSTSYSIATIGCNFKCAFCQNWEISQLSKMAQGSPRCRAPGYPAPRCEARLQAPGAGPGEIVKRTIDNDCKSISYTYTEPTIFFEFAYDIARLAKSQGLYNNFVTNGYMTQEALRTIRPYLDAANVDLKGFSEDFYSKFCKASLGPVLESIRTMKELGIWVEVTTLIIPGQNDSDKELRDIAGFIVGVGPDIPWHVSRFHPEYRYLDSGPTPVETLKKARSIGKEAGLRYVYLGNVIEGNDTYCYNCSNLLIKRSGFDIIENNIDNARCKKCGSEINGLFL